jgi:acyl-CoA reductase-like NAD-dependent aldehyde dehydrogenase
MAKRGEEAITALAQETGASRVFSQFNLAFCIQVLREAAAAITRPVGELLPTSIPGAYSMAQRIPFGVVGGDLTVETRRWSLASGPSPFRWPSATPS